MTDFTFTYDGGTIALLAPNTEAATEWLAEHAPAGPERQYLGDALAIEARYCESILRGLTDDGLTVE